MSWLNWHHPVSSWQSRPCTPGPEVWIRRAFGRYGRWPIRNFLRWYTSTGFIKRFWVNIVLMTPFVLLGQWVGHHV
jgi:hypothetical protein